MDKDFSEFKIIDYIKKSTGNNIIGDDCAVLPWTKNRFLLVSTDISIENVHFQIKDTGFKNLAVKNVNINVSDIAAMGGEPEYIFVSMGMPEHTGQHDIKAFINGLIRECKHYKINLAGGDISSSDKLIINITITGFASKKNIIYRNGAQNNDIIFITNSTGNSAAGFYILAKTSRHYIKKYKKLVNSHLRPQARLAESRIIRKYASSLIDISDGLSSEIYHICEDSNKGCIINYEKIPRSPELQKFCFAKKINIRDFLLNGGEDYELLGTCPADKFQILKSQVENNTRSTIHDIGVITGNKMLLNINSHCKKLKRKGFVHFEKK